MPDQIDLLVYTYTGPAYGMCKWLSNSKHKQTTLMFLHHGLFSNNFSYFNKDPL